MATKRNIKKYEKLLFRYKTFDVAAFLSHSARLFARRNGLKGEKKSFCTKQNHMKSLAK
jgi:hypothetical protein